MASSLVAHFLSIWRESSDRGCCFWFFSREGEEEREGGEEEREEGEEEWEEGEEEREEGEEEWEEGEEEREEGEEAAEESPMVVGEGVEPSRASRPWRGSSSVSDRTSTSSISVLVRERMETRDGHSDLTTPASNSRNCSSGLKLCFSGSNRVLCS